MKIMGNIPCVFGSCNLVLCVGPGIPILSYLYKVASDLDNPRAQSEIDNKSLWKTCFQTDKKDSKEKTTEDKP